MTENLYPYRPTHRITLSGCDDATMIDLPLDPAEVNLLEEISQRSYEIGGGCCPTLSVTEI